MLPAKDEDNDGEKGGLEEVENDTWHEWLLVEVSESNFVAIERER